MDQIDSDLRLLQERKRAWARLPVGTKIEYLLALRRGVAANARAWVDVAIRAKSIPAGDPIAGEEWISGPWAVLYAINRYVRTLREIAAHGSPRFLASRVRTRADGRVVADVYPRTPYDRFLLNGVRAEVWMQPGVRADTLEQTMGLFYRKADPPGSVALVLGAGNISSIAPLDVLYKFIADGSVCMLKMNPVNEYLGPILERCFEPFVSGGYLRFAYGGADVGKYLCEHDLVEAIHITGSERTHDAIVAGLPHHKPVTSELGNVSPTIVIPGDWSDDDFRFQAENIATQKMHNAGYNCVASQVVILPRDWRGTPRLIEAIADVYRRTPPRVPYYPGSRERYAALVTAAQDALIVDEAKGDVLPRALVRTPVDSARQSAFSTEAFCNVLAYVELPGDAVSYVRDAVAFANDRLHGTLGANLIVHPATQRDIPSAIDQAIADLRYGCIGVNAWTGVGYFLAETPWGAYPGHTLDRIGSGIGVVHNAHLFSESEKSVVYAPFRPFPRSFSDGEFTLLPRPPFFITNRMQAVVGERLCEFEANPSPVHAASVALAALRG
ncbi:MAG: aldehyde dehydrogenase family protein [Vulcanimicrobiaceae bacterium]